MSCQAHAKGGLCITQLWWSISLVSNLGSWGICLFFPTREKEPPPWDACLPLLTMVDRNVEGKMDLSLRIPRPGWKSVSPPTGGLLCLRQFQEISFAFPVEPLFIPMYEFYIYQEVLPLIFSFPNCKRAPLVSSYRQTHQTCSDSSINSSQPKCKDCLHNSPLLNQLLSV